MNFSAVILAGGKSSRMGRDKAWLEIAGQTLLARQIGLAQELGAVEIFISGRADVDYSTFGWRVLQDRFSEAGPLAGIERALDTTTAPMLLVLAVDLPEMSPEFLRTLAKNCSEDHGVIPCVNGRIEPLAAFYPKTVIGLLVNLLDASFPLTPTLSPLPRGVGQGEGERITKKTTSAKHFAERCVQNGLARFVEFGADDARHFINWNSPTDLPCQT